ncbi:hypothetical protein HDU76_009969 [Blyttiomyces sp. JEL0837]|nr:hypothetical protein HDU76_009969 [Blyttiomyces sp. JEL0837]
MAGGGAKSRGRRNNAIPFNLMVAGHSHTGKSSFIRTLVESLNGKRVVRDTVSGTASPVPGTATPSGDTSAPPSAVPLSVTVAAGHELSSSTYPGGSVFPINEISTPTPTSARIEFEEEVSSERISLRLVDTPGLAIPVNIHKQLAAIANGTPVSPRTAGTMTTTDPAVLDREFQSIASAWADTIIQYVDAQYEATLIEESKVRRNPKSPDFQTHACLYFLDPTICLATRGLTPIDRYAMKKLASKMNVIPVFGKADLMTTKQLTAVRKMVSDDIRSNDIGIFAFPEDPEEDGDADPDLIALNQQMRSLLPFAVVNDEELDALAPAPPPSALPSTSALPLRNGGGALGRLYPWGMVEVENEKHCDVVPLRSALFGTHLEDLKVLTREVYYEQWRTERLLEVRNSVSISGRPSISNMNGPMKRRVDEPVRGKITLKTEVSKVARAAIASSRNRQLVKPALSPTTASLLHPFKNMQTASAKNDTVILINNTFTAPYKDLFGSKLFLTKVPVSVGQSGNFALSLTTTLPFTFVRGPNCTTDVASCTGATIKLNDPDIVINDNTNVNLQIPFAAIGGPFVNTTSFTVGTVKSTHFEFIGFNKGVNFSADTFGDGIFSLTNGNAYFAELPVLQPTSWLLNAELAADNLQAGLYLPFYDRPNDHGELSVGGYDSARFTGPITYFNTNTTAVVFLWGFVPTSVTCTINGTTAWFKTPPNASILAVEPLYDFVTMNDDCFQLVLDTFNPQMDPKTNALIVDCVFLTKGPNVQLTFEGQVYTMGPESYIFRDTSSGVCVLLFTNIPGEVILGAPFLINYYSIYDISNSRFGLAKAAHSKYYSHTTTK